jgi:hypothetical protein
MRRSTLISAVTLAGLTLAAGAAQAAPLRYFTYEADSESARFRSADITLVVKPGLLSNKVFKVYRKRGDDLDLHNPGGSFSTGQLAPALPEENELWNLQLYAVDTKEGAGFARGACKGADKAWIAFKPVKPYQDLKIYVLKLDAETKAPALCETLSYRWRGEWKLPERKSDLGQEYGTGTPH